MELGLGGPQRSERQRPVAQDEDAPVIYPTVHAPRHLQEFVVAQVHAGEDVAAALHQIREAHVINDDGVQPRHVERALPRRRHREHEGPGRRALQEGTDGAQRLAAVVVEWFETDTRLMQRYGD
ncbi:hypothetical protein [Myxococcus sp. AB036A]|uniref:hypothetical protein n=1 Tax=Myxococcus sp. AB036A TaxID=2562793 RepID=UPI001E2B1798|nr:hypothetical protein [Myxococcus sp. AB036A]